jgi:hypothetical protein
MDQREAAIIAQTAAKAAAQIFTGTGDVGGYIKAVGQIHQDILTRSQQSYEAQASNAPAAAPAAAPPVTAGQAAANVAAVFPQSSTAISAASTDDELWADVIANPDDWWNNSADPSRGTLFGGNGPDFRHKTLQKNGRNVALWLYSRRYNRTAPDAVFAKFGLQKPGTDPQPVAAAAPAATPPTAPPAPNPFDGPF